MEARPLSLGWWGGGGVHAGGTVRTKSMYGASTCFNSCRMVCSLCIAYVLPTKQLHACTFKTVSTRCQGFLSTTRDYFFQLSTNLLCCLADVWGSTHLVLQYILKFHPLIDACNLVMRLHILHPLADMSDHVVMLHIPRFSTELVHQYISRLQFLKGEADLVVLYCRSLGEYRAGAAVCLALC